MKLSFTICLLFVIAQTLSSQNNQFEVGSEFPLKAIATMSGGEYSIEDVADSLLVMNFWNIGCRGCEQERPYLNDMYQLLKDEKIAFWSVTLNDKKKLSDFLSKHPIDWPLKGDVDFMGIAGDTSLMIKCMPTTIVLDNKKNIIYAQCGPILEETTGPDFKYMLLGELER